MAEQKPRTLENSIADRLAELTAVFEKFAAFSKQFLTPNANEQETLKREEFFSDLQALKEKYSNIAE